MTHSELIEWGAMQKIWADDEKAAMDEARAEAAAGKGSGASLPKGSYPHGIGPGKGPWGA